MAVGDLKQLKELSEGAIELLNAVGVESLVALAESEISGLHDEVAQANGHLELLNKEPSLKVVDAWVTKARKITGKNERARDPQLKVVGPTIPSLPVALAVEKEQILKSKIAVGDVPVMVDFVEDEELSAKVAEKKGEAKSSWKEGAEKGTKDRGRAKDEEVDYPNENKVGAAREKKVLSKSAPLGLLDEEGKAEKKRPVVEPLKRNAGFDIRKTASPELNEGKKLHSRSYVRGVLHPQPVRVKLAAFVSLMAFIFLPLSFVAGGLVILKDSVPIAQPLWLLTVPAAFLFFGFLYFAIAKPLKCRICGQPLLASKRCFRHIKAHRFPLIGYIVPTSLHMLLFHWFRCIYCGTSVRLKE